MSINSRSKKIIFIKDSKSGSIKQAVSMDLYLRQRQQAKLSTINKIESTQFLVGVPPSQKTQYRKNCCGRKS